MKKNIDVEQVLYEIEKFADEEDQLQKMMNEKEQKGWDLKFQNYWGYIVSADDNYEQTMNMCEKLFKHVGEFRKHSTDYAQKIIDQMYNPHLQ